VDKHTQRYYVKYRGKNYPASVALRAAKIRTEWDSLECDGLVRIEVLSEIDSYESIYGREEDDKYRREINARIENEGFYIYEVQYRLSEDSEEWVTVDSLGGFIGDDWFDSGYDIDMMASAIDALRKEQDRAATDEAEQLMSRATYALT
jgi:hypothetical protein